MIFGTKDDTDLKVSVETKHKGSIVKKSNKLDSDMVTVIYRKIFSFTDFPVFGTYGFQIQQNL